MANTVRSTAELLGILDSTVPVDPVARIKFSGAPPFDVPIFRERERAFLRDLVVSLDSRAFRYIVTESPYFADPTGGIDATAAIQAAITDAQVFGGEVYIPQGTYKVTSTIFVAPATGLKITGAGRGSCLVPTAFAGKVISIQTGSSFPENALVMEDFVIRAAGITAGQIGFGCTTNSINGLRMARVFAYKMDVGFHLRTAQFCSFDAICATQCTVGLKLDQDAGAGGGNNNTFLDCCFVNNVVGMICWGNSIYPMAVDKFINLTTHTNSVCAVYLNNLEAFSIENWAPEANGAGAASVVIDGNTILNSILHCENAVVELGGYVHVSNTQNIYANNKSRVTISGGASAAIRVTCDPTSFVTYGDSVFAHYSSTATAKEMYALQAPLFTPSGQQSYFLTEPLRKESRAFPNEACGDSHRTQPAGGTTSAFQYVFDALMGSVLSSTFSDGTKQLILTTAPAVYTGIGTRVIAALLVKAGDSTAQWQFDLAQSSANVTDIVLEAGKWYTLILTGVLTVTPRTASVIIKARNAAAFATTLQTARLHCWTETDQRMTALAIREGIYNPNIQPKGGVSPDRGDQDVVLTHFGDYPTQRFDAALTANRIVTLPTYQSNAIGSPHEAKFRIVRTGLGAFTLAVKDGGTGTTLKTMPVSIAAWSEYEYRGTPGNGGLWVLTGYAPL